MNLPEFIMTAAMAHNTSLGDNKAFPAREDVPYEYTILKASHDEAMKAIENELGYIPTVEEAENLLSKLVREAMEKEKPLRPQLEKLCEATVNNTLGVPQETVLLDCELTDRIEPDRELRIMPEILEDEPEYEFKDVDEIQLANIKILKRRMIDSLVQGISHLLMLDSFDTKPLRDWSDELVPLYLKIIRLNSYLLFTKKETITDKNPMLGAYVETDLGQPEDKTVISSQGLIYPLLLQETYRGFFELFASHGLPDDIKKAMYIIKRADFVMAEAWDLRMGYKLWQEILKSFPEDCKENMWPYIFSTLVQLDEGQFNDIVKNLLCHTKKGRKWVKTIVDEIKHDDEYNQFKQDMKRFNLERTVIDDEDNTNDDKIID